jgi:hypothetical protein
MTFDRKGHRNALPPSLGEFLRGLTPLLSRAHREKITSNIRLAAVVQVAAVFYIEGFNNF